MGLIAILPFRWEFLYCVCQYLKLRELNFVILMWERETLHDI